MTQIQS
jgi:hypothetical protein